MMDWEESLARIESPELDAELNVVSGTAAFFRAVGNEPAVQQSLRYMSLSGERQEEILNRIADLAMVDIDPRYENPNDTPLAVLLWLTCFASPKFAHIGARYVEKAPQCWYASKLARQITAQPSTESSESWVPFQWGTRGMESLQFGNGSVSGPQMSAVSSAPKVLILPALASANETFRSTRSTNSLGDKS